MARQWRKVGGQWRERVGGKVTESGEAVAGGVAGKWRGSCERGSRERMGGAVESGGRSCGAVAGQL